ncbi:putative pyridoxal kinase, partial [Ceratobasidium sp. 370]
VTILEVPTVDVSVIDSFFPATLGNKAAIFPLQLLGWDVDAINTVQFSNHAGYRSHGGTKTDRAQLLDIFSVLERNEFVHSDALLTGYIPGADALSAVADFGARLKEANPNMVFLIDPVMGDDGIMYVADDVLPVYHDRLLPLATIITPNWFEAELLTKVQLTSRESLRSALKILHNDLGVPHVVITSVIVRRGTSLHDDMVQAELGTTNILATNGATSNDLLPDEFVLCVSSSASDDANASSTVHALAVPRIRGYFSGVGDLFSALVLAHFEVESSAPAGAPTSATPLSRAASRALHTTHTVLRRTQEHALKVAADESSAYTDDEQDANEPLRRIRRMKTRELRLVQSRDDILACADGRVEVKQMKAWNGFWED